MDDNQRIARLLDAVQLIAEDLAFETVLERIVQAACSLVDARYGALGVIDEEGDGLSAFVHHGIDEETAARIGDLPRGHGVLGHLIEHPEVVRLDNVAEHPASYGFPAHHPPMHTFLGAPIRISGEVFGNLYLTEKTTGDRFTAEDEALIVALATVAGSVISNARLYDNLQRREVWRDAVLELSSTILAGEESSLVQARIAGAAQRISGADAALLVAREPSDSSRSSYRRPLRVLASVGDAAPQPGVIEADGAQVWDTLEHGRVVRAVRGVLMGRPTLWVPVREGDHIAAALGVVRSVAFSHREEQLLVGFGEQVSVAWAFDRAQAQLRRLSLIADRERIGRDLHDTVIQRLFATGLSLQAVAPRVDDRPEVADKLARAVDEIDTTVKDIRATIFALQPRSEQGRGLRSAVLAVVDEVADSLGFSPRVRFDGPVDHRVPDHVAAQVVPVIREALTNVAKHARAQQVQLDVGVVDESLQVIVIDDGVGIGNGGSGGYGLHNLHDRAAALRGQCEITTRSDRSGTSLRWVVPLPTDASRPY